MKIRLFTALLAMALLLTACVSAPVETNPGTTTVPTTSTTAPTDPKPTEKEEVVDLFGSLYPVDGKIPRAKDMDEILLIEAWESKRHQEIHIEQPHMSRLRELKPDFVLSTQLGEFELK